MSGCSFRGTFSCDFLNPGVLKTEAAAEAVIRKMYGENTLRLMAEVERVARSMRSCQCSAAREMPLRSTRGATF